MKYAKKDSKKDLSMLLVAPIIINTPRYHILSHCEQCRAQNELIFFASSRESAGTHLNITFHIQIPHGFPNISIFLQIETKKWNCGLQRVKLQIKISNRKLPHCSTINLTQSDALNRDPMLQMHKHTLFLLILSVPARFLVSSRVADLFTRFLASWSVLYKFPAQWQTTRFVLVSSAVAELFARLSYSVL